ncbi:hypothetical protein SLS58_001491 [Diplodia intermedia]|uniref:Ankyrin repeat protein n=1 Tax=Diplodia intermedia TaxID=856260 RepID=A0ABR3U1Q8_9PEZI
MEVAGLAIGAVGLAALIDSCKRLMGKIDSARHVASEARPILVEFSACKHLFDRWLQHVTVCNDSVQLLSGESVSHETVQVVQELISYIEDSLKSIEATISEFRLSDADDVGNDNLPSLKRATGLPTKTRLKWALSKKEKAAKGVQEFFRLIQKLDLVISVSGPSGDPKHEPSSTSGLPDEVAARLDKLIERFQAEDRRNIHQWLGAKSTESYYEDQLRDHQDGTCSWVFDRPDFVSWASSEFPGDSAKLLWLHAPAGFGKTVLCAQIAESLKHTAPDTTALYFFSERENDPYAILRSWISQVIYQHDGALRIVADNPRLTSTATASHRDLEEVFRVIVQSIPDFNFVVDGLDECEDTNPFDPIDTNRHRFVGMLRGLTSRTRTRIMIASRPFLDIHTAICSDESTDSLHIYEISISEDDVDDDLKAFSKAIVNRKLPKKSEHLRADLANQMAKRASGMFLWVKLHQGGLLRSSSQAELQEIISHMPAGLDRTYSKNLERIQSRDRVNRDRAHLILMWIMVGKSPPTVAQIAIGFAVQNSGKNDDLDCNKLPELIDQNYIDEGIIDPCAGLVEVKIDSRIQSLQDQSIRFVHSSVRDYLLHVGTRESLGILSSDSDLQRGHLCEILLRFVNYEYAWKPSSSLETNLRLPTFLDFAILSWLIYFPATMSTELRILVDRFFSLRNDKWERWRNAFEELQIAFNLLPARDYFWYSSKGEFNSYLFLRGALDLPEYPEPFLVELISKSVRQRKLKPLLETEFIHQQVKDPGLHHPGTRVYYAVHTNHTELVRAVVESDPESINALGGIRGSALQLACGIGFLNVVTELIKQGADVNLELGPTGYALNAAVCAGNRPIIQVLLDAGANVNGRDSQGWDALFHALLEPRKDILEQLLQHGADTSIWYKSLNKPTASELDLTALHRAAFGNEVEAFEILLKYGADISVRTYGKERSCLHLAARKGSAEIVDVILRERGHDLLNSLTLKSFSQETPAPDSKGQTPLLHAIVGGHFKIAHQLVSKGANCNAVDNEGYTPLFVATALGSGNICRMLLDHGANPKLANSDGNTPLHRAVEDNSVEVVDILLERTERLGTGINAQDSEGRTPLSFAISCGSEILCRKLLDHGADLEQITNNERTPLHLAVDSTNVEVVRIIHERTGMAIDVRDNRSLTPLHWAVMYGQVEVARYLLDHGASVNATGRLGNFRGVTPLHIAAVFSPVTGMIDLLVESGADVSATTVTGHRPLWKAADAGQLENYKCLLHHGADERGAYNSNGSVLHWVVLRGNVGFVQYLLDRGWDTSGTDAHKRTVFHIAAKEGHTDVLEILLDHGGYTATVDDHGTKDNWKL